MTYVVLPFQMYTLPRSVLAVGLIGVVEFAPMVGPKTLDEFKKMERFNPDKSWTPVPEEGQ